MIQSLSYYTLLLKKDFHEYCNKTLKELDLSQGLLFYIIYIGKHPNTSPKQLTEFLHMDTGHTTRTLTKLEDSGFITQKVNKDDKRSRILNLTKKGEEAFELSHHLFSNWDQEIMNDFSPEEREQLLSLLNKLIHKNDESCFIKK